MCLEWINEWYHLIWHLCLHLEITLGNKSIICPDYRLYNSHKVLFQLKKMSWLSKYNIYSRLPLTANARM